MMDDLTKELERCREWIQAALDEGNNTHSFEDIEEGIRGGYFQFWPADRSCAITEIIRYPNTKSLHIFLAAGDKDQIVDMQESAEHFARMEGCTAMTIAGRRGWVRELKIHGYEELLTTVVKRLDTDQKMYNEADQKECA